MTTLDEVMRTWAMDHPVETVTPHLIKRKNNWCVQFVAERPDPEVFYKSALDEHIAWVEQEAPKWLGTRRMAWDMWYFDDKRTAEKFITLYHLIHG